TSHPPRSAERFSSNSLPHLGTRLRSDQFTQRLLIAGRRVAEVGVDPRALVQHAAGVRVGAEAPLAVVLAHPGIANAAEGQVGDERLDRAVVDRRVSGGGRVQDLLRHMLAFREVIEAERAWPRIDEVDHLLDVVHLTSRWLGARPDPGYSGQKPVSLEATPMPRTKKRSLPSCRRKIPPGRTSAGNKRSSSISIPTDPVSVIGKT